MITITDDARDFLTDAFAKVSLDAEKRECFRIAREEGEKLAIVTGKQNQDDIALASADSPILVIGSSLCDELGDRTLDIRDAGDGRKALIWA